jgi:hypothetical protein
MEQESLHPAMNVLRTNKVEPSEAIGERNKLENVASIAVLIIIARYIIAT